MGRKKQRKLPKIQCCMSKFPSVIGSTIAALITSDRARLHRKKKVGLRYSLRRMMTTNMATFPVVPTRKTAAWTKMKSG